jgi:hypothetical protein
MAVAAAPVQQGLTFPYPGLLHFADQDRMISAGVTIDHAADDCGDGAANQRRSLPAEFVRRVGERISLMMGKSPRDGLLIGGEHVYRENLSERQPIVQPRPAIDANQHQGRRKRHRGEGRYCHAGRSLAVDLGRDYGNSRGQVSEGMTEFI